MKTYEIQAFGIENLALVERPEPAVGDREALVKFHAASLNYRDLMMVKGSYNPRLKMPLVPFSDGAGEVVAVGAGVTKWKPGDRVMPAFMQGWIDGGIAAEKARTALGGDRDGVLREFGAFDEDGLVRIPDHFSYEEAATLPCAAVTAYHALFESGRLRPEDTILLQGTGGVSIFALQLASVYGARTIITSSSDEKLRRAKELGADELINYREREDWDRAVLELTGKRGVDTVVEVGGAGTLQKSVNAVRMGGHVAVIGVLSGKGEFNPTAILMKSVRLQGIFVGSRQMFEQMNLLLCQHSHLKPIIDKTFGFGEVRDALMYLESGKHFGKIVVKF
ncbi:MAG: NAD(P)-dependent alcohol dehydrogenase [Acidobacteria bacterium]|nr:NAD(P)-dependent alcohol dehydrogenase [Acidobacteriota bacterium]